MTEPLQLRIPSPMQRIVLNLQDGTRNPVWVKRDDLIDDVISGNKWRKLQFNLFSFEEGNYRSLVTIGGAFSNHLAATARACQMYDIPVTGLVRSGTLDLENPTLRFCASCGMKLMRVDRSWSETDCLSFAEKNDAYWLPEGGSNAEGVRGIEKLAEEILSEVKPQVVFVSVGSGGTLAGLVKALPESVGIIAVSSFDTSRMKKMMLSRYDLDVDRVVWPERFTNHGFGKFDQALMSFASRFYRDHGIPLDPIYTVKTAVVMEEMLSRGTIPYGQELVFIHTGGLQGWKGYHYRFPHKLLPGFVETLM